MVSTTCPSLPMRMNALGTNTEPEAPSGVADAPIEGWVVKPINKPPPSTALALRKRRREMLRPELSSGTATMRSIVMSGALLVSAGTMRRMLDSLADSHVSTAATDVPGHGGVDVAIGRARLRGEQCRRGHDLAGLAITALRHLQVDPRLLDLLPCRRGAYRLDRGDALAGRRGDRRDARAHWLAVEVDRARAAQRRSTTELGAGEADHVPDRPQERRVGIDIDLVFLSIHVERGHQGSHFGHAAPDSANVQCAAAMVAAATASGLHRLAHFNSPPPPRRFPTGCSRGSDPARGGAPSTMAGPDRRPRAFFQ